MTEVNIDEELFAWLRRYARGAADRAATWHIAMLERPDSLHDDGPWQECQHVSCAGNREYVEVFTRLGIPPER